MNIRKVTCCSSKKKESTTEVIRLNPTKTIDIMT